MSANTLYAQPRKLFTDIPTQLEPGNKWNKLLALREMTAFSKRITYYVLTHTLQFNNPALCAATLERWIHIETKLIEHGDFASAHVITSALHTSEIFRLSAVKARTPNTVIALMNSKRY
jgi:hypothetical protein